MFQNITTKELGELLDRLDRAARTWAAIYHYSPLDSTHYTTREALGMLREMQDASRFVWSSLPG